MGNDVRTASRSKTQVLALAIAAGVGLLLAAAIWAGLRLVPVSPRLIEGWAAPNGDGTAIGLFDSPSAESGEGYIIAGADWRDVDGPWNDGTSSPTCVGTDTRVLTHVRLGLVKVRIPEGSTREQVVWMQCLE